MIYNETPRKIAKNAGRASVSWLNAFGTFAGLVGTNIWDFVAGGVVIAGIFGGSISIGSIQVSEVFFGFIISAGFWFIQLLLWKNIIEGGLTWSDIPAVLLAIVIGVADTNLDTSAAFLWIAQGTPFLNALYTIEVFQINVGTMVVRSLTVGLYVMGGFGELFNALYFRPARYKSPHKTEYRKEPVVAQPRPNHSPTYSKPTHYQAPLPTHYQAPLPVSGPGTPDLASKPKVSLADLIKNNPKVK